MWGGLRIRKRWLVVGYALLLALSHVIAGTREHGKNEGPPRPITGERHLDVAVQGGEGLTSLAYREHGAPGGPVLVLLHGSPGSASNFQRLTEALAGSGLRLLVPDLPGFGASRADDLPDYSVEAHAAYLELLLEELEIPSAHVLGYSMGGGVAIELAAHHPDRVRSLILCSSIGVQELEFFGTHELNHAVHGMQLWLFRALRWFVPHFGIFDRVFGEPYPRNFYDTDQRPLRGYLEQFSGPALIIHGDSDFLVPYDAAREHHRILPQSELVDMPDGHFFVFTKPDELGETLRDFVDRVENGRAPTRSQASPERIATAAAPFDYSGISPFAGPALVLMFLLLAVSTFVSEDLTCIAAGFLVAQGRMEFIPAAAACIAGIFLGDMGLYFLGRFLGRPAMKHAPMKWLVTEAAMQRAATWLDRKGIWAIFASRFMPGTRLPLYFFAGVLRTKFGRFALFFLLAALVWTPILVGISAWLGKEAVLELFERYGVFALLGAAVTLLFLERVVLRLFTWRGRRELVGSWRRWTRFEFWPPLLSYLPLVPYLFWLALRRGGLTVVTAVNPGIKAGGFIGESKAEILEHIKGTDVARHLTLRTSQPAMQRQAAVKTWMEQEGLTLPLVIKPDVGQRGSGVRIVRTPERLEQELDALALDEIVQEFADGEEFGVFWLRRPGSARGELFSITRKVMPVIVGDGKHTVEELILRDPRAVCMAKLYLRAQADNLDKVLSAGESLTLVHLGTHCLGAIFENGNDLATDELLDAVERIVGRFEGFDFGRLDLRVPDAAHLARGEGIKVIELNGVTSEATHIYDARTGIFEAYRVLFEQWRVAFAIGAENRRRGIPTTSTLALVREWRHYRKQQAQFHG